MEEMRIINELKALTNEKEQNHDNNSRVRQVQADIDTFCNDLIAACEETQSKQPNVR